MKIEYVDNKDKELTIKQGNIYLVSNCENKYITMAVRSSTEECTLITLPTGNRFVNPVLSVNVLLENVKASGYSIEDITDRCKFVCDAAFKPAE